MTPTIVITAVRDRLGDSKKQRWDDSTLLLYVSLCQNDICTFTHFYRKSYSFPLELNKSIYTLPSDYLTLNRLEYNGKMLPIESRPNIDSKVASFPCVLKDNLAFNELEFIAGDKYNTLIEAFINVYGVVVDSTFTGCELDNVHGVVTDVTNEAVIPEGTGEVLVYYSAIPPLLKTEDINTDLIMPDTWLLAFIHYVCGMALQDDNDASNIQRGEGELQKYLRLLTDIHSKSSKDFTSNMRTKLETKVRRI